jgi:hypothetical protein
MDLGTLTGDLGCFPFEQWSLAPTSNCHAFDYWYSEFDRSARFLPVRPSSALPPVGTHDASPKSYFGENQLLPGSISFSLLTSGHPMALYNQPVRSSTACFSRFNLPKVSSPGFGSCAYDHLVALFTLAFAMAPGVTP